MPILKNAKKAQRQTKKRTLANKTKKEFLRTKIADFKKSRGKASLGKITSLVDKMIKKGIIHKNKAGRIKSTLAKISVKTSKISSNFDNGK
ncbi:30S ribosomal protein S20 [Candidatus Shapirobacteria bacterium CG03_land_8_20_14_0_80_39_12]|uniref:Small ribosomal subunit protein bS20 n=1 Tax=Candidatus Shapirobacteria bacterium CG03_land_8_20_14_0_80_39_12 TaxID=1974879 RepID=A0A2M7BD10_9BACT|nr:MAG: 30S ribosomal protein S20 [Candidatus Shapirobacteria bacterium CG03_land_8_20_14_0_80_39_12]